MTCEGRAKGNQSRQQLCSSRLVRSEQAVRAGGLGEKEEHTRADESLATKLENQQLGIANNCMSLGSEEEDTFCQTAPS